MTLIFEQSTSTVWLFATSNELLELSAIAQQKCTEAKLGEDLTVLAQKVDKSQLTFRISVNQYRGDRT